jgi:hypothetical protein
MTKPPLVPKRRLGWRLLSVRHPWAIVAASLVFVLSGGTAIGHIAETARGTDVTGTKRVMVLRVYFNDYTATSRYSRAQVEGFFGDLNKLWTNTSYGKITIASQVTDLYKLPSNRSAYVDDFSDGDLSNGAKYWKVLNDAIDNAPTNAGLDWSNLDAIMVVMAETSTAQFHRGQATSGCTLKQGPGGANKQVGCAIFSENPTDGDVAIWGRWAHEIGHAFQVAGPAHPSNYNSNFELMDSNMPGQTGAFEKQADKAFPGWLPPSHYQNIVPNVNGAAPTWAPAGSAVGGALVNLRAVEYDPATVPNLQATRAYVTASLYYLVSVRRRVLGDDLDPSNTPNGIPDEGVLIERVFEGGNTALNDCAAASPCPRWVEIRGQGGNVNALWKSGQSYFGDGVSIGVDRALDPSNDNWQISVRYDLNARPDVLVSPWRSPPSNTWESTDIWVDSPVNGFGVYRYGMRASAFGDAVPAGNGDDPAAGQANRIYARVRNLGTQVATNVVVRIDRTNPEGRGINGANGFVNIGSATIPSIPAGGTADAFVLYTPAFTPTADQVAAGRFHFHTCVRVRIDALPNEAVLGNQDGDGEQENIDYFEAAQTPSPGAPQYADSFTLRNNDPVNPRAFNLSYTSDTPPGWRVAVNNGVLNLTLKGGEVRRLPIVIRPRPNGPRLKAGTAYHVDVLAQYQQELVNPTLPPLERKHQEFRRLGGVRVEARVVAPSKVACRARRVSATQIAVTGLLRTTLPAGVRPAVLIVGARANPVRLLRLSRLARVDSKGRFSGVLLARGDPRPDRVVCMFAGTSRLATATSGLVPIG